MKKSLVTLIAVAACLALAGVVFAVDCGPMVPMKCDYKVDPKGKIAPPKCGVMKPCAIPTMEPGGPYVLRKQPAPGPVEIVKEKIMRDLCVGQAKGKCPLGCGPCVPMITWSGEWKTAVICGVVETQKPTTILVDKAVPVKAIAKPCPPPDCYF